MRRLAAAAALLAAVAAPAAADWTPVRVGPYGPIISQDWGLYRPGHGVPRVLDGPTLMPEPRIIGLPGPLQRYFPSGVEPGDRPPPRAAAEPRPAEPFFRMWTTPPPLTVDPTIYPPYAAPPVIVEPRRPPK